jgi:hypothetical protein
MERDDVLTVSLDEIERMSQGLRADEAVASRMRTVLTEIATRGMSVKGVLANRDYLVRTYTRRIRSAKADHRQLPDGTAEFLDALQGIDDAEVLALIADDRDWAADIFATADRKSIIGCIAGEKLSLG